MNIENPEIHKLEEEEQQVIHKEYHRQIARGSNQTMGLIKRKVLTTFYANFKVLEVLVQEKRAVTFLNSCKINFLEVGPVGRVRGGG